MMPDADDRVERLARRLAEAERYLWDNLEEKSANENRIDRHYFRLVAQKRIARGGSDLEPRNT